MRLPYFLALAALLVSCSESPKDAPVASEESGAPEPVVTEAEPKPTAPPKFWSELAIHKAIRAVNPVYSGNGQFQIDPQGQPQAISLAACGVSDIGPLKGMALQQIDLSGNPISDLSPLKGMPLIGLYLEDTNVEDLTPLAGNTTLKELYVSRTPLRKLSGLEGVPIEQFNAINSRVEDLSGLAGTPLKMAWFTGCNVTDITPLRGCPMESLTLHQTPITDLSPLAGTSLQRLHIGETPVTDLTPLAGLPLTRLVFDYDKIEKGLDVVKAIPSITEIGTAYDDNKKDLVLPAQFWAEKG